MHATQDSLSRRLGPVFAEVAALAARGGKPGLARAREMAEANPQMAAIKVPAGTKLPTTTKALAHCAQHEPRL